MRLPQWLGERLREIRREMRAPPHSVKVKRVKTSYCDLRTREVVLARRQLGKLGWVYRHEILHLDKYPRTLARELYWAAKVMNRLEGEREREFFRRRRGEVMNMAEDAVIDYELARTYGDAREYIRRHAQRLLPHDPPPHELARMLAAGLWSDARLEALLEERDVVSLAVECLRWLMRHPQRKAQRDAKGRPSREDFEDAAADLAREGEELGPLFEFARDEGVHWDLDRALLKALVRSYEWYMSAARTQKRVFRSSRARQGIWSPGDSPEKLDMNSSLAVFPRVIPGLTAIKREPRPSRGLEEPTAFKDVALLVDESGSMRDKERAVRAVGLSILGWLNRRRVQYQVVSFGHRADVRVPLGHDYIAGAKYFATQYHAWQLHTFLAPALELLRGRDMLVYVVSDAEIHDLHTIAKYRHALREVVLVLVSPGRHAVEPFTRALPGITVRGYWVPPGKIDAFVVQELGRLA